ncbi:hypothetical protein Tsac_2844 [Thermoanaerobacterium phage THSA-485A]|uniref:hypothetical protein n=1 Tax=Thermoanaerobacterium phage THSA-485A TaxID=1126885 RepID=UPI000263F835|nr:hypothetical protein Tsac_2844 [Thermoanaerobacterium phage THSA-485A]AFK87697.1 hypothetical protein Tsac_2844 [Thermoanaerobacterium phage THSA-485A]
MTGYLFQVDTNGKIIAGQAIENWVNGDANVWNAQERSFYNATTGQWTIYDPIQINAPATASINTAFNVAATLPTNSPDTSVEFNVIYNGQAGTPIPVNVTNLQATQQFNFAQAGTYTITVSSEHHGSASAEVTVS